MPKSVIRARITSGSRRWQIVVVVTCLLLSVGVVSNRHPLGSWVAPVTAVLMAVLASSFWYLHLQSGGLPGAWCFLFSFLLAAQSVAWLWRAPRVDVAEWQAALGCAAFTYAMLWVFEVHNREAGLRALATAALLLSIGILAKPPVLICCALLTLAVFFDERRRTGRLWHSMLLLLTPVLLCTVGVAILHALAVEGVADLAWTVDHNRLDPSPLHLSSLARQIPALPFCAAVLTTRLLMRKTASPDLAFLFLLLALPTLGMAPWMPKPLSIMDVSMIISWGAACLLALDPPIPKLSRTVALAGASLSLYFCR